MYLLLSRGTKANVSFSGYLLFPTCIRKPCNFSKRWDVSGGEGIPEQRPPVRKYLMFRVYIPAGMARC